MVCFEPFQMIFKVRDCLLYACRLYLEPIELEYAAAGGSKHAVREGPLLSDLSIEVVATWVEA
jgi:hypothetical protein